MSQDASLNDFIVDEESDALGGGDRPENEAATEAGLSTFAWSPDGAPCATCEDQVECRWRDDGHLVCESCKEW